MIVSGTLRAIVEQVEIDMQQIREFDEPVTHADGIYESLVDYIDDLERLHEGAMPKSDQLDAIVRLMAKCAVVFEQMTE